MDEKELLDKITKDKFNVLSSEEIKQKIGIESVRLIPLAKVREKKQWAQDYLNQLYKRSDFIIAKMESFDLDLNAKNKRLYSKLDSELYKIGDIIPIIRDCITDIDNLIFRRSLPSLFASPQNTSKKALDHGGIYNNPDPQAYGYDGKRPIHKSGPIKGVSL